MLEFTFDELDNIPPIDAKDDPFELNKDYAAFVDEIFEKEIDTDDSNKEESDKASDTSSTAPVVIQEHYPIVLNASAAAFFLRVKIKPL